MSDPVAPRPFPDVDPIDSRLARAHAADLPHGRPRSLAPLVTAPQVRSLVLVPLGAALGPAGLNFLSVHTLAFVDPVVSVALATIGILLAFDLMTRTTSGAVLPAAGAQTGLTIGLVAGGALTLGAVWTLAQPDQAWLALMLGVCAAASVSMPLVTVERLSRVLDRASHLDNLLAILAGAGLLMALRSDAAAGLALLAAGVPAVAGAVATAGWLLVGRTSSEREQHAFVAGTLLMLGGAAAYLQQSALFFGLLAGVFWARIGGAAREPIARDVRYVQHPLVVLLLLVAGARLVPTAEAVALGFVFLLGRTAARFMGARLLARQAGTPVRLAPHLLSPGIVGIGIALDGLHAAGDLMPAATLLMAVAVGTLTADLFGWAARGREDTR